MKKPRLLTKIPRNPDDTEKKPDLVEKNPAVATLDAGMMIEWRI